MVVLAGDVEGEGAVMDTEQWADIPGFDGYQASTHGRVRSFLRWGSRGGKIEEPRIKKLTKRVSPSGLVGGVYTALVSGGKNYHRPVHRLVLEAFVGPRPEGMQACHYDKDATNNHIDNLRWDTKESGGVDTVRKNAMKGREGSSYLKKLAMRQRKIIRWYLTLCAVNEVRFGTTEKTQREIAKKHNISEFHLSRVLSGKYKIPYAVMKYAPLFAPDNGKVDAP